MVLVNEKDVYVPLGTVVLNLPLADCDQGAPKAVATSLCKKAAEAPKEQHVDPAADGALSIEDLSCFAWSDETLNSYRGTLFHQRVIGLREWADAGHGNLEVNDYRKAIAEVYRRVAPVGDAGIELPSDKPVVLIPCDASRPEHHHEPSCKWQLTGDALQLVAIRDVDAGAEFTVFYGQHSTAALRYAFNATAPSRNPHDSLEISFEVPPFTIPALQSYFDEAEARARKENAVIPTVLTGNMTKHYLTLDNPCPLTLRLATRFNLSPNATEDQVDEKIEKVFVAMKESIFSGYASAEGGHIEVRQQELNLVIAAVSRLSHNTTLRRGGACHRIIREPPTLLGETLSGVPLEKCLSSTTAVGQPALAYESRFRFLNEQQLVAAQAACMRKEITTFVPEVDNFPLFWTDAEKKELEGTSAGKIVKQMETKLSEDVVLLHQVGINISDEDYKWGFALRQACGVALQVPEETVRIKVTNGKSQPIMWEDEDGDRIKLRLDGGKLIYSVNDEDRPAVEKIDISDGVTLAFPLIDREIDLPPPGQAKDAYQQILATIRALAEDGKINHNIPPVMEFAAAEKTVELIIPGAAKLPHLPTGLAPTYLDGCVWYQSAGGEDDILGTGVVQLPGAGDGEILAKRGDIAPEDIKNKHNHVAVVQSIPCRALGAEESAEDIHRGAVLQACNLIAQSGSDEVEVAMPDLEQLSQGVKGLSFTITHKVTKQRPVPKSLLYAMMLQTMDPAVVVEHRAELNELEGIRGLLRAHGDFEKATAAIKPLLDALAEAIPSNHDADQLRLDAELKKYSRVSMALRHRMQERVLVQGALAALPTIQEAGKEVL